MDKERVKSEILSWGKTIIVSIVIAFLITLVIKPTVVKELSMYPTLDNNDFLIVNKIVYKVAEPQRGDIIIFDSGLLVEGTDEEKRLVKRIVGLPNDKVEIRGGNVYINEELFKESYLNGIPTFGDVDLIVASDEVFVMGDNRPVSLDSRNEKIGPIKIESIYGKALIRLYPFNKIGLVK